MKFRKYIKESTETTPNVINEGGWAHEFEHPDKQSDADFVVDEVYGPIEKLISEEKFEDARRELTQLSAELDAFEQENNKKRFFRYPKFLIDGQRRRIDSLMSKLPTNESIEDMDKRCENCNTLLSDDGTCPKCDGGDEDIDRKTADDVVEESCEETPVTEELSNREKLLRAFPELDFSSHDTETEIVEELTARQKLKKAFPELNFEDTPVESSSDKVEEELEDLYDDDYAFDDVEEDRLHAALYGGDLTYCKHCGEKLIRDEWGSYCPECDKNDSISD